MAEPADAIEREIRIGASPEAVFAYFTDAKKMVRWKGIEADLDPRVGGLYRVVIDAGRVARGEFRELVPNQRVVFTWGWEGDSQLPPGSSTVEVTLAPDGEGTVVRLIHRDLPAPARKVHAEGWDRFLPRLASAAVEKRQTTQDAGRASRT
jgi:uncharacterized protein YndB with AHSA1/START domain